MQRGLVLYTVAAIAVAAVAGMAVAQPAPRQNVRPQLQLKPEAKPDEAVIEAGTGPHKIDVLLNDIGVPPEGEPRPQVRLVFDTTQGAPPVCGRVKAEGDHLVYLVYEAPVSCIGKVSRFGYEVDLRNEQTRQNETVTGVVTVTIVARAFSCARSRFVKIEGGTFEKARAPEGIADILALIDPAQASFTVMPFCFTRDPVSTEDFTSGLSRVPEAKIQSTAPEWLEKDPDQTSSDAAAAAGISRRMATLYIEGGTQAGEQMTLPTLQEIVAAAWELQATRPEAPETRQFLLSLRTGNLLWTSSRCDTGEGKYFVVGSQREGYGRSVALGKVCYTQERRHRASFRLVVRQL